MSAGKLVCAGLSGPRQHCQTTWIMRNRLGWDQVEYNRSKEIRKEVAGVSKSGMSRINLTDNKLR